MSTQNIFDVIVIGAGSGGLNIASFMNSAGFTVLLIDKSDPHIGGDCLNFGCIPSKALLYVAGLVNDAKKAQAFGIQTNGEVQWSQVKKYIFDTQEKIRAHENADWFRTKGITVELGEASFVSKDTVSVQGKEYTAKKIVLATGSRPRMLNVPGIEYVKNVLNNETIFTTETLPKKLLVIGGGPIGIEIAQALQSLGVSVTVVDPNSHILSKEDKEIAGVLYTQMQQDGVEFCMHSSVREFRSATEAVVIDAQGEECIVSFDAVFIGIGRVLNTEGLELQKAGIAVNTQGKLVVDAYLRTTNKKVFVCGDIAGNYQFTHAAEMHASVILKNFFSPFKKKFNADAISWTTFTNPEIASFGLQEQQLQKRGVAYQVLSTDFNEDDRAITDGYQNGKAKLFVSPKGHILGGTMVAPHAGEIIGELVLAVSSHLKVHTLFNKTYAYPTASRINKRMVSNFFKTKLTTRTKKLLKLLFV